MPASTKLHASNELVEDVTLPYEFSIALMTARPELLKMIHRPLTADETQQVAHAFGVLIETHRTLHRHCEELAQEVEHLRGHFKGVMKSFEKVLAKARFQDLSEDLEDL